MCEDEKLLHSLKPVVDSLQKIKFTKAREAYKAEHGAEIRQYHAIRKKLMKEFSDGKIDMKKLNAEYRSLTARHATTYAEFKAAAFSLRVVFSLPPKKRVVSQLPTMVSALSL